ncbi:MAG TPA: hypothetical protein VM942_01310 [Acidimicrobiales bacterium]|nr:hypothetical protein [Acidimicrobiales bacterium]
MAVGVPLRARLSDGGPDWVGSTNELHTKGWLPYTLTWTLKLTEPITDAGFALEAIGDLKGSGRWTFEQDGPEVSSPTSGGWRPPSPSCGAWPGSSSPFAANHRWAMARGQESLQLELRRRRATSDEERRQVPPPPPPTFRRLVRRRAA